MNTLSTSLYNFLKSNYDVKETLSSSGEVTTNPKEMKIFNINFHGLSREYSVVISIMNVNEEENTVKVVPSKSLADENNSKIVIPYQKFLRDLKKFTRIVLSKEFDLRQVNKADVRRERVVKESKFSKACGSVKTSQIALENTKIIIKHTSPVNEDVPGARSRRILKIYILNPHGEKFLLPNNNIRAAKAHARHIHNGGCPYDNCGLSITGLAKESNELAKFIRRTKNKNFIGTSVSDILQASIQRLGEVRKLLNKLCTEYGYNSEIKNIGNYEEPTVNDEFKNMFLQQNFDDKLQSCIPYAMRAFEMNKNKVCTELDEFKNWANSTVEEGVGSEIGSALGAAAGEAVLPELSPVSGEIGGMLGSNIGKVFDEDEEDDDEKEYIGGDPADELIKSTEADLDEEIDHIKRMSKI